MNKARFASIYAVISTVTFCCFGGACTSIDGSAALASFIPPDELEAGLAPELAFVVNNRDRFAFDGSEPLFDLPPDTVMDDISGLDGCWGSAAISESSLGNKPLVAFYYVYRFDAATGKYAEWALSDSFGFAETFSDAGTFSIEDPGHLQVNVPHAITYTVTRLGDQMRIHYGGADRGAVAHGDTEIHTRFDCPE